MTRCPFFPGTKEAEIWHLMAVEGRTIKDARVVMKERYPDDPQNRLIERVSKQVPSSMRRNPGGRPREGEDPIASTVMSVVGRVGPTDGAVNKQLLRLVRIRGRLLHDLYILTEQLRQRKTLLTPQDQKLMREVAEHLES